MIKTLSLRPVLLAIAMLVVAAVTFTWVADGQPDFAAAQDSAQGESFGLDENNTAPTGIWSDGTTMWVSN